MTSHRERCCRFATDVHSFFDLNICESVQIVCTYVINFVYFRVIITMFVGSSHSLVIFVLCKYLSVTTLVNIILSIAIPCTCKCFFFRRFAIPKKTASFPSFFLQLPDFFIYQFPNIDCQKILVYSFMYLLVYIQSMSLKKSCAEKMHFIRKNSLNFVHFSQKVHNYCLMSFNYIIILFAHQLT